MSQSNLHPRSEGAALSLAASDHRGIAYLDRCGTGADLEDNGIEAFTHVGG